MATIYGAAGADRFSTTAGDVIYGGAGDDVYETISPNITIVEKAGEGIDTVRAWSRFTLPDNVENLMIGANVSTGIGNGLANVITSTGAGNTLKGMGGNDTLIDSGSGQTIFSFSRGTGADTVQGFIAASGANHDVIQLTDFGIRDFSQLGSLLSQQGSDVMLRLNSSDSVLIKNVALKDLTADDFLLQTPTAPSHLSFGDEFNGLSLYNAATNTGTWKTNYWFGSQDGSSGWTSRTVGGAEQSLMVDPMFTGTGSTALGLNPFSLQDGVVSLTVAKAANGVSAQLNGLQYTSGMLSTEKSHSQTYGYFEVKAQAPTDKGVWPAIWLLAADNQNQEIDIVEQVGDEHAYQTAHSPTLAGGQTSFPTYFPESDGKFHTYGLLWDENYITWFLDDVAVARIPTPADMHKDMYLIVSMGGGGSWPGSLSSDFQSASLKVDYVHIYDLDSNFLPGSVLNGTAAADTLLGKEGMDTLVGGAGDDTLDGGAGGDRMEGGLGNDYYIIDDAKDVIVEKAGEGIDTVASYISTTLAANVENLTLIGGQDLNGTGNELNNFIKGNIGDNVLNGGAGDDTLSGDLGNDTLIGGAGNDTYLIESWYFDGADKIVEDANGGIDTVRSKIDFTLGANLENLILLDGANNGLGNELNNVMTGNAAANWLQGAAGDDTLIGGAGDDRLTGGTGADVFVLTSGGGKDTVDDFSAGDSVDASALMKAGASWSAKQDASGVTVSFSSGESVLLKGVALSNLKANSAGFSYVASGGDIATISAADAGKLAAVTPVVVPPVMTAPIVVVPPVVSVPDTVVTTPGVFVARWAGDMAVGSADAVSAAFNYSLRTLSAHNLTLTGTAARADGNDLGNLLVGNASNNEFYGYGGDDTMDGGAGADIMFGGLGNDTYIVDNVGDQVYELDNDGGVDTVISSVNWTLGNNFENLTLSGSANINATGNGLGNVIKGNDGNNRIDGGAGNDTLTGGAGADTFVISSGGGKDVIEDFGAGDTIDASGLLASGAKWTSKQDATGVTITFGGGESMLIKNLAQSNVKVTASGFSFVATGGDVATATSVDAGKGVTAPVDTPSAIITQPTTPTPDANTFVARWMNDMAIGSADAVSSSFSYSLRSVSAHNLFLTGTAARADGNDLGNWLVGNASNNELYGYAGDDTLDGGAGRDVMYGGLGNDTYIVDNVGDQMYEFANDGGVDTVISSVSWSLGANIENLVLSGSANINATGNSLANVIIGNAGDNHIDGGGGADTLTGGGGADTFVITARAAAGETVVTDFSTGDMLDISAFESRNLVANGADVVINLTSSLSVRLLNTALDELVGTSTGFGYTPHHAAMANEPLVLLG